MTIAVQAAVGPVGGKATTEITPSYAGLVNCGKFQYGVNASGVHLLNTGSTDDGVPIAHSFTLASSDYGDMSFKRIRYLYLEVEVYEETVFTASVKPNKGTFVDKTVTVPGPGLKTVSFTIQRSNVQGNFHTIKISATKQFRVHKILGLFVVRPAGVGRL